jgi:hypothetical protein
LPAAIFSRAEREAAFMANKVFSVEQYRSAIETAKTGIELARQALEQARQAHRDWQELRDLVREMLPYVEEYAAGKVARRSQAKHARAALDRGRDLINRDDSSLAARAQQLKRAGLTNRNIARRLRVHRTRRLPRLLAAPAKKVAPP